MVEAVVLGVFLLIATTLLHHEAMRRLARSFARLNARPRYRVFGLVAMLLSVHLAEIAAYAGALWASVEILEIGAFAGLAIVGALDYFYFSTVTYTSLGLGDFFPLGHVRFLTGLEALNGLLLIAWSGAYTYLAMGKFWSWDPCHGEVPATGRCAPVRAG